MAVIPNFSSNDYHGRNKNQVRAAYMFPLSSSNSVDGNIEIENRLSCAQRSGLNAVYFYVFSGHIDSVLSGSWDPIPQIITSSLAKGIQFHLRYPPYIDKYTPWSIELRDNPTWVELDRTYTATAQSVCYSRPEVRNWEVNFLKSMSQRYPNISGIHLEEPGSYDALGCFCSVCGNHLMTSYSLDISNQTQQCLDRLADIHEAQSNMFVSQLNTTIKGLYPGMVIGANGSFSIYVEDDRRRGRCWHDWAVAKTIDYYSGQIYDTDTNRWTNAVNMTTPLLNTCKNVASIGVSWSGGSNTATEIKNQILSSQDLGLAGFALFRLEFLTTAMEQAIASTL